MYIIQQEEFYWSALFFRYVQQQIEIYTILPKKRMQTEICKSLGQTAGLKSKDCHLIAAHVVISLI